MTINKIILAVCVLFAMQSSLAGELQWQSGDMQTLMIELYTSEGCNSCPPAEAYLNSYADHPKLWRTFVPLAFHVDYWDYLGWKDPFATPEYSQRQRHYGRVIKARTIYTPEFFVNGREWRRGFFRTGLDTETQHVGNLQVVLSAQQLSANFTPVDTHNDKLDLNIAVLGMGLESHIKAGENAGRSARHEFAVLAYHRTASSTQQWKTQLPSVDQKYQSVRKALVVWISRANNPVPIQAVGGFLLN